MRILRKLFIPCFLLQLIVSVAAGQYDTTRSGHVYYLKLRNGMNAVLMPIASAPNTEITFYLKTGGDYEIDSLSGVANILQHFFADKIVRFLDSNQRSGSFQNTAFRASTTSDHTVFQFNTSTPEIPSCLALMRQLVFTDTMPETDLEPSKDSVLQHIELAKSDSSKVFEQTILKNIYRKDYEKLNAMGDSAIVKDVSYASVNRFYKDHYVPDNAIITATGNFNYPAFDLYFRKTFDTLLRNPFPYEGIMNINDFRPMIYSSQFILEDSTSAPEFHICWQFPGTNSNNKASYAAHLLATMLNDNDNFIQVKARKMGCKKLLARYEANNFTSILRVIVQPDTSNFFATYRFIVNELSRLEKTIVNESMMNAAKIQFKKDYEYMTMTKEFPEKIVHHTAYKDNRYYSLVIDSVLAVTEKAMKAFVLNYMSQIPHVTGLKISKSLRESLKLDSAFNTIDDKVSEYVFRYRQNITDLEGEDNLVMQNNLLQWLSINSDVYVQVNGYSDESEYERARDKSMMDFVDSIPTFRKRVADLIQKGYFSPAMMRSMKIIRFLYLNGIPPNRLSGTGMKFHSDTDEEEIDNMKCTLTFDKLRQNKTTRELYIKKEQR